MCKKALRLSWHESGEQQADHGEADHGFAAIGQKLIVSARPSRVTHPGKDTLVWQQASNAARLCQQRVDVWDWQ